MHVFLKSTKKAINGNKVLIIAKQYWQYCFETNVAFECTEDSAKDKKGSECIHYYIANMHLVYSQNFTIW
jgi:hypothetical protein